MVGRQRAIEFAISLLLLFLGLAAPSLAEGCCDVDAVVCCCADASEVQCDTTLCGGSLLTVSQPAVLGSASSLVLPRIEACQLPLKATIVRAPKKIEPSRDTYERPPPPLFVNKTLCFLPPPVI